MNPQQPDTRDAPNARALAFYLPQFHPIPENDEWWGKGFTEWTNTARARPRFPGQYQPHVPADLGFYDLRCAETREAQAELARSHGLEGFIYWHYWFAGRRLLERPFAEVLASGSPDFSFCLAWANETWTGIWHGAPYRVLVEQIYPGPEDDRAHFEALLPAFSDPRYVTVGGRPLFYVFHPEKLPSAPAFVERWQRMAVDAGLPGLYLVAEVSDLHGRGPNYLHSGDDGFDAGVYMRFPAERGRARVLTMRLLRKLRLPEIYEYSTQVFEEPPVTVLAQGRVFPTVYPGWDNTPRSGRRGIVLHGSTPQRFAHQVEGALRFLDRTPADERLLFVKSWNEWAEGNHLEPDMRHGHGYLEALRDTLAVDIRRQPSTSNTDSATRNASAAIVERQRRLYADRWAVKGRAPDSVDRVRLSLMGPHLVAPILDVGAGDGLLARTFCDQRVVSLDMTTTGLEQLAGAAVCAQAEALPIRAHSFRTVVLSEVLEHVGDPVPVLQECHRLVEPGGRIIITVPAFPIAKAEQLWRRRRFGARITAENVREWDPEHERRYTDEDLRDQLSTSGWTVCAQHRFFRSATTAAFFFLEPRLGRMLGRSVHLTPAVAGADRLLTRVDAGSEILVVAEARAESPAGESVGSGESEVESR